MHPLVAAVAAARVSLAGVADSRCWSLSDAEVTTLVGEVVALRAQIDELALRMLAAASTRELAGPAGSTSCASWWAARSGRTRADAGSDLRLAGGLDSVAEATRQALAAGRISVDQASAIVRGVGELPAMCSDHERELAQAHLLELADPDGLHLGPAELHRIGRRVLEVIDPDGADAHEGRLLEAEERRARQFTWLRMRRVGDGTTRGSFRLPDAQADMLRTVLEGYAAPRRTAKPAGNGNGNGGIPGGGHSGGRPRGEALGDLCITATAGMSGEPCDRSLPSSVDEAPPSYSQRLGLALCELIEHVPLDGLPQAGGLASTATVIMQLDTLLAGADATPASTGPAATLSTGLRISPGQARRLACGTGLVPMVFNGPSIVLDAGREQRLHDRYQRLVMTARDGGCIWAGCDRPAAWCEAHHLRPWSRGGHTSVEDGCLLCPYHHRLVHEGEWRVHMASDGVPEVIPPARVDPTRRPRRHTRFLLRRRE